MLARATQAIDENKLLIVDYHDAYLPFLDKINALDGRKAYATRTIYFLNPQGTLKPIAIELALLPGGPSSQTRRVVTLPVDATSNWIWQLAKARVSSNDAGIHQPLLWGKPKKEQSEREREREIENETEGNGESSRERKLGMEAMGDGHNEEDGEGYIERSRIRSNGDLMRAFN
ncbi:hypothetical protein CRG98_005325 [Punica granatum]|uniref:Lipoxygenase domain-containing protein n=1 Tax=Punica granatum TaxID=22663 RepID=A0A2I0L0K9_PUNGR|nr:hypothetical protein CRG98_005325 [Punica granatum]